MDRPSATGPAGPHVARILAGLYAFEFSALLGVGALYKTPALDWSVVSSKSGAALVVAGICALVSTLLLVRFIRGSGDLRRRAGAVAAIVNLVSILATGMVAEVIVRVVARRTPDGLVVGSVRLRPTWPEVVARSREVMSRATPSGRWEESYFVYDHELGWTVGRNRRSADGLYFSSVEGLRSAGPEERLADANPDFRVALVGDSNAFSLEVPFEDSWGHHLQGLLGDNVQVLNFGVDGYGIDQMYLRYRRDVSSFRPEVVVVGFIPHDLVRTMAVYPLVSFGWPAYFVKPRFVIESGELRLLNAPLPDPDEVLAAPRIRDLPHVEYDLGYGSNDWFWRFDGGPLALRFLTSAVPRWTPPDPRVSADATDSLNTRLFAALVDEIRQHGAEPVVVFLPSRENADDSLARAMLEHAAVPFVDATRCLDALPADHQRVPSGAHFTGAANRALARCTFPAVERALAVPASPPLIVPESR